MSKTTILDVQGMSCGHCVKAVDEAIRSIEGVEEAHVDLAAAQAKVVHAESADIDAILAAIADEGYSAKVS